MSKSSPPRTKQKTKDEKIDLVLQKLDNVFVKLNKHDKQFNRVLEILKGHGGQLKDHGEQLKDHDAKLDRLVEKSIDHDQKLSNMVTKADFSRFEHRLIGLLDQGAEQLDRLDKEQAATQKGLVRVEQDIVKIKRHLKLST